MRYFACAALLALLTVFGCDNESGSKGSLGSSGSSTPLTITTTTIPGFTVPGIPGPMPSYSANINATGGSGSYTWSIVSGTLPAGLTIAPSGTPDTTITGTMTSPATTTFTVQVTDSSSNIATQAFTLTVMYAPTPPPSPPVYFGQPVTGRVLFICDMSSAMAGQGVATLQTELTAALSSMTSAQEFDIIVYNEAISGFVSMMWGTPLPATTGNVNTAIAWINGPAFTPAGGVDYACYLALQTSFSSYTTIDSAFLYTWGTPGDGSAILASYPGWAAYDPNRYLTTICKGGSAHSFAQQLAALAGGTYVP